jgi:4,5-dihydroxyphthalate decarboxylase
MQEGDPRVARLWPDYKAEDIRFYQEDADFPNHARHGNPAAHRRSAPWVPRNLFHAFEKSKAIAMRRMENPRIVPLAWYLEAWNEQQDVLGPDPWQ